MVGGMMAMQGTITAQQLTAFVSISHSTCISTSSFCPCQLKFGCPDPAAHAPATTQRPCLLFACTAQFSVVLLLTR